MRALARPEIFEYDQEQEVINSPIYVPCPANGVPSLPEPDRSGPYLVITPACANAGETVQVEGFGFAPNTSGPLRFVPGSDPANIVAIGRDNVETDDDGHSVNAALLSSQSALVADYPVSRNIDFSFNIGYRWGTKTSEWQFSVDEESFSAYWESDAPIINNTGLVLSFGFKIYVF